MQYIFLSHDVDWRRQGPSVEHILARKDRFEHKLFEKTKLENLYRNIPESVSYNWEIGLHTDPASVNDLDKIHLEKEKLESITRREVVGNRVHYLNYN